MSHLEELLRRLCSEGVEHRALSDVARTIPGLTGKSKADFAGGTARYVSYKNAYANAAVDQTATDFVALREGERQNQLRRGDVVITGSSENFEDVGMSSVVATEPTQPLYLNSFCFALRFADAQLLLPEFSKYLFRGEAVRSQIRRSASGVTRINISKERFMRIRIPVPPPDMQREIGRILGSFSSLESELSAQLGAEVAARSAQHSYTRNRLLSFPGGVPWRPLGDLAEIGTGSRNTNEAVSDGLYPFFVRSQAPLAIDEHEFDEPAIITAGDGVGVGKVFHFIDGKYALHQRAYRIRVKSETLLPRFLFHFIRNDFARYLATTSVHASVTSLRKPMFHKYPVPVPPVEQQRHVVTTLDHLEALVNDLVESLDAERGGRRGQYEYYRDKLLTFEEATA